MLRENDNFQLQMACEREDDGWIYSDSVSNMVHCMEGMNEETCDDGGKMGGVQGSFSVFPTLI